MDIKYRNKRNRFKGINNKNIILLYIDKYIYIYIHISEAGIKIASSSNYTYIYHLF